MDEQPKITDKMEIGFPWHHRTGNATSVESNRRPTLFSRDIRGVIFPGVGPLVSGLCAEYTLLLSEAFFSPSVVSPAEFSSCQISLLGYVFGPAFDRGNTFRTVHAGYTLMGGKLTRFSCSNERTESDEYTGRGDTHLKTYMLQSPLFSHG